MFSVLSGCAILRVMMMAAGGAGQLVPNPASWNNAAQMPGLRLCWQPACGLQFLSDTHNHCCKDCRLSRGRNHSRRCYRHQRVLSGASPNQVFLCVTPGCQGRACRGHLTCCSTCHPSNGQLHTRRCLAEHANSSPRRGDAISSPRRGPPQASSTAAAAAAVTVAPTGSSVPTAANAISDALPGSSSSSSGPDATAMHEWNPVMNLAGPESVTNENDKDHLPDACGTMLDELD